MYWTSHSLFWFVHGLIHRYTYFMRTIPGISHLLKPLDDAIDIFINVLLQVYVFNRTERFLFSIPAKYGGMGLTHFRPMFPFCSPWKHQKTFGLLVFSGGIKWEHWLEMGLIIPSEICQEEYENSQEITKEITNKVMRNKNQFQDNCVSTAKIKNNIKNQKKKLNNVKLQEVTNNISIIHHV